MGHGEDAAQFSFVNLTRSTVIWKERTSAEKMPPSYWPIGKPVGMFLSNDSCGRTQPAVGGATPAQAVLEGLSKPRGTSQ